MTGSYREMGERYHLEFFKERLQRLKESYENTSKQFDSICEELDASYKTTEEINAKSAELTVLMSYLDDLENKIKLITEIIENLKSEI